MSNFRRRSTWQLLPRDCTIAVCVYSPSATAESATTAHAKSKGRRAVVHSLSRASFCSFFSWERVRRSVIFSLSLSREQCVRSAAFEGKTAAVVLAAQNVILTSRRQISAFAPITVPSRPAPYHPRNSIINLRTFRGIPLTQPRPMLRGRFTRATLPSRTAGPHVA